MNISSAPPRSQHRDAKIPETPGACPWTLPVKRMTGTCLPIKHINALVGDSAARRAPSGARTKRPCLTQPSRPRKSCEGGHALGARGVPASVVSAPGLGRLPHPLHLLWGFAPTLGDSGRVKAAGCILAQSSAGDPLTGASERLSQGGCVSPYSHAGSLAGGSLPGGADGGEAYNFGCPPTNARTRLSCSDFSSTNGAFPEVGVSPPPPVTPAACVRRQRAPSRGRKRCCAEGLDGSSPSFIWWCGGRGQEASGTWKADREGQAAPLGEQTGVPVNPVRATVSVSVSWSNS